MNESLQFELRFTDELRALNLKIDWVSSTLSQKTQTSVIKSGLSLPISLDGGDAVLVAWSWQWWQKGCGFCGMGFCWVVGRSDG